MLVVDFDDTCTASDSIGLIMQTAIEATVAKARRGAASAGPAHSVPLAGAAARGAAGAASRPTFRLA